MFEEKKHLHRYFLICCCMLVLVGCGSGEIQNFEGIQALMDPRTDRLEIRIYLLDRHGNALIWNQSILSPSVGVSTISEADFFTHAEVYSMRDGKRNKKVYDGRLIDVRWSQEPNSLERLLSAEIPRALIEEDLERDTHLGVIVVEVKTDKQGPFTDTIDETSIYRD